jgi:high affinity Mn2+ porin
MRRGVVMRKVWAVIFCLVILSPGGMDVSLAAEEISNNELLQKISQLEKIVKSQETRIKDLEEGYGECKCSVEEHDSKIKGFEKANQDISGRLKRELSRLGGSGLGGLDIGAGLTFVGQGTPNANNAGGGGNDASDHSNEESRFDGSWSADIEIAKEFEDHGLAFLHLEAGQGDTVEGDLSLFSNVNRDAGDSGANVQVTEAWYEHYLFSGQITLTAGKIDATGYLDTNEFANDETTQFLGHMFRNADTIDWPDDNNFGGRIGITLKNLPMFEFGAIYMEEDADWENIFDEPFIGAQINFMIHEAFGFDPEEAAGNYRMYIWYNGAPHAKIEDTSDFERGNIGFGLSFDQQLAENFGLFARYGWADPDLNNIAHHWSFGGQMTGYLWDREEDIIAIAVGQVIPGKEYANITPFHNAETHLEAYYSFAVNDHLTFSPDFQVIWYPNGGLEADGVLKDEDPIFVYGVRGQVDF